MHGGAGTFDLPLTVATPPAVDHNPVTEPRRGFRPHTIVLTFNASILSAAATITEGAAVVGAPPTFSGNDVIVDLIGVSDIQYVTLSLTNVTSAAGGGGAGSVRIGFLMGDVNQNRVVTLSDVASSICSWRNR